LPQDAIVFCSRTILLTPDQTRVNPARQGSTNAEPLCQIGVEARRTFRGLHNPGAQIMSARAVVSQAVLCCLTMVGVFSPAHALSEQELVAKLQSAGYSQIREIKSTAEGTAVRAMKNGKEVSLVVDSSGQIRERR
jgi:hypothetical protein